MDGGCSEDTANTTDWDDSKSYSSISILKEHDFNAENEPAEMRSEDELDEPELNNDAEHCSMSTGDLSSSSLSSIEPNKQQAKRNHAHGKKPQNIINQKLASNNFIQKTTGLLSPVVYSIMRERTEEQVQLNFTLQISANHLNLNLIDRKDYVTFSLEKMLSQLDINNIYQKFQFKLKAFDIFTGNLTPQEMNNKTSDAFDRVIFTSNSGFLNQKLYLNVQNQSLSMNRNSFVDLTFTRALISNFNKKYQEINRDEAQSSSKHPTPVKQKNLRMDPTQSDIDPVTRKQFKQLKQSHKSTQKWISEVNISVGDFDVLFHMKKLSVVLEFHAGVTKSLDKYEVFTKLSGSSDASIPEDSQRKSSILIPLISPCDVPLLNIEIGRVRFILLLVDSSKRNLNSVGDFDLVIAQFISFNLTSSIEYPIVRNFVSSHSNSASYKIYNKYKSNGMIYRPGFAFEDRQYLNEVKNVALFKSKSSLLFSQSEINPGKESIGTIIGSFSLRFIIGLPIVFANRLVNGYLFEVSVLNQKLEFYLGSAALNLILDIINQNVDFVTSLGVSYCSSNKNSVDRLAPHNARLNKSNLHNQSKIFHDKL